jgi:hypothetical protein
MSKTRTTTDRNESAKPQGYCALFLDNHTTGKKKIFNLYGKIVLFDTVEVARDWCDTLFSDGRVMYASPDGETITFHPVQLGGINSVTIGTKYDPYNLPAGFPVRSEAVRIGWRRHILCWNAFVDHGQFKMVEGVKVNTMLDVPAQIRELKEKQQP